MKRLMRPRTRPRHHTGSPVLVGQHIGYKNGKLLRRFISEQGKILPRKASRLTSKQQRVISKSIKIARILAILPFKNNDRFKRVLDSERSDTRGTRRGGKRGRPRGRPRGTRRGDTGGTRRGVVR